MNISYVIKFKVRIVVVKPLDSSLLHYELIYQEEWAALLPLIPGPTPAEDHQAIHVNKGWFHVEVLDVYILSKEPFPLALGLLNFWIFLEMNLGVVDSWTDLKFVCVEVSLRVDRQSLVFIVLDIDLLTDEVERRQSSGVAALLKLKIVGEAHLLLIAAKEQYIGDPSVSLLKRDSRPMQLFRYAT